MPLVAVLVEVKQVGDHALPALQALGAPQLEPALFGSVSLNLGLRLCFFM